MDRLISNRKKGRVQLFGYACPWLSPGLLHWKKPRRGPKLFLRELEMRSSLRLIFAVVLVCSASAWPLTLRQEQAPPGTSPDQNKQEQSPPTTNPPAETAPPAANNPASPTTTVDNASAATKPPVLKHRKRKTPHSSSAKASVSNSDGSSSKVVVRNGGAKEGSAQLAPAVNPVQAQSQR